MKKKINVKDLKVGDRVTFNGVKETIICLDFTDEERPILISLSSDIYELNKTRNIAPNNNVCYTAIATKFTNPDPYFFDDKELEDFLSDWKIERDLFLSFEYVCWVSFEDIILDDLHIESIKMYREIKRKRKKK